MSQVWVAGEVLIDLIPDGSDRKPIVGGGPANTAKALAKIGIDTHFIDGISFDKYGQMAKNELVSTGVKLDYVKYSDKPTCIAIVSLSDTGSASYEFVIENTATFDFTLDWLPNPQSEQPALLHIGTLATVIEPGASVLFEWAQPVSKGVPIVFDPNIRPAVMDDRKQYVKQVERWVSISSAVKVSDEDIRWLYPSLEIEQVVDNWLAKGPSLIVVTSGDKGLVGYRVGEKVSVDAIKVAVADTVGAGDTVGAILIEAIVKDGLDTLSGVRLEMMLKRAAKAAAITVSRSGANPPTLKEIE
ncbi:fructokinase [Candidatus Nanopelagicus hibericus]|uniref:Fructokinase n=1 Tax=Candidatus Nanopelagicus hibericus TaxID=1884915 RepID=A0A249KAN7_9ACTN|nr:carbohydrate kinase [Candidatus Nanopelagicus hibericus]ASY13789.1 fructokinase [Candidatus Nanopelagicus hibericus]